MPDQIIVRTSAFNEAVQNNPARFAEAVNDKAQELAPEDREERTILLAAVTNAMGELAEHDNGGTIMSTAQNGVASRLQAALVASAADVGAVRELRPARQAKSGGDMITMARLLEVRFDNNDWWGWVKAMSPIYLFKPEPAPWQAPPDVPDTIANDAVVALFSDWGTGLYGACIISDQIKKMDRCDVALHMGDTYYAGSPEEVASRLVSAWPLRTDNCKNYTLNGNHEMYSGGKGYFQALAQAPFRQSSSCIALQNDHWLLLGLDTAYIEAAIDDRQAEWIGKMVAAAAGRKVVLFSHHQVYSKIDAVSGAVERAVEPLLLQGKIYAWYFGHEHRLVLFDAKPEWGGMKARCMGHGGFPEFRRKLPGASPEETRWWPLAAQGSVPGAVMLDGPNPFVNDSPDDPVKYAPHGYAVLTFDGEELFEAYFDPDGGVRLAKARV